jgi:hypothetical protein
VSCTDTTSASFTIERLSRMGGSATGASTLFGANLTDADICSHTGQQRTVPAKPGRWLLCGTATTTQAIGPATLSLASPRPATSIWLHARRVRQPRPRMSWRGFNPTAQAASKDGLTGPLQENDCHFCQLLGSRLPLTFTRDSCRWRYPNDENIEERCRIQR